ncbi:phage tail tape measure protein [Nocardia wallacei]|uniref:phage tail tape measure protein n=1 Tax=Nocardia wallacei TaxID=480035 RepID=UPI002455E0B8|nr:phage tail tape measure protein [Nocardia wallacei]
MDRSFSSTGASIERGGLGARNAARDVERFGESAQGAARDVDRIQRSAEQASSATRRIDLPAGLSRAADRASEAIGKIGSRATEMSSTGTQMGDSFVSGFAGKLEGLGGKGGPIAMSLVGVAAVGLAAGSVLAKAISDGMQMEKDAALVQARLGVSDEQMKVIGTAAGDAFANGWGESVNSNMDAVSAAIQAGLLNGTETAGQMQPVIEKLNVVSQLMGEDLPAVARSAGQAVKNGIAKDAAGAFDLLVKAQQNSLNNSDDLLDSFDEYSTQLRALGLQGAEGWALVAQGVKAGARDTDVVIDALKEFKLRVTDGTAEGADGFDKLGVKAEEARKAMSSGGQAARDMMATLLRGLQNIKDPQDRYNAALALFGTKFEDIQDAAYALNLDTATQEFGNVAGAADQAANTIGDTTAHKFEAARNSITQAMDGVKFSIAEAFGPTLQKAADWVSAHQPEIISFFTHLADAGFACLDGLIAFASGSLRAFATFQEGIGDSIGKALAAIGGFTEKVGGIIKHIPGLEDTGKAIEGAGKATEWYGGQMDSAADKARQMADLLDGARPKIDAIRDSVRTAGEQSANAAEMARLFGADVNAVPDGKAVRVEALTDEAKQRLEEFGFKVETLPDGTSRVTAETKEAQKTLDDFVTANTGKPIPLDLQVDWQRVQAGIDNAQLRANAPAYSPESGYVHYADGTENHRAQIAPAGDMRVWAEPETGGEAYIPLAQAKRSRSTAILADVAARFGYDLLQFSKGGLHTDDLAVQARGIEGAKYVWGGWSDSWDTDCSGAASRIANLAVYGNAMTGGRFATDNEGEALAARGFQDGPGPDGSLRIGWINDPNMPGGGHTAVTLPDGTHVEMGGAGGNGQYGGRAAGAQDFPNVMHLLMDPPSVGAGSEKNGGADGKSAGTASTSSAGSSSGSVQDVRVVNWPASLGGQSSTDDRKPIATLNARWFADGSEDHTAQIASAGDLRVWGEPETGGEAYIPLSVAKRARSTAILASVAHRFGLQLTPYAMGGFGGLGQDGDGGVHTGSWEIVTRGDQGGVPLSTPKQDVPLAVWASAAYRAAAFGAGLALTGASGWDADGKFRGFDTGNTSIPGLDKQLEALGEKLTVLIDAVKDGKPVQVDVDVDSGRRTAELNIRQLGV